MRGPTHEPSGDAIEVPEHQSQALGERAAGVDFIRDFDLGIDILPHLHADRDTE